MKRIYITITALVLFIANSFAQANHTDYREKLLFGVKVGANSSNVYDSKGEEFRADSKFGLASGIFIAIPVGKFLGIQPEILFSQKGFKATGKVLGNSYEYNRTTNFIDVPLFIQVKPVGFLTLLAGPQYSYLIKQKDVFSSSLGGYDQEQDFKNENIRKNILCFVGGVDLNLNHFVLGARLGWDVQNNNGDGTSTVPRYKNAWYQATLGFSF